MNVIELEKVIKAYSKHSKVLDEVDLAIPEGTVFGLLGRNGAGKTTLIRLLMAMIHPTSGSVRVFGEDPWSDHEGIKRRIGFISENQVLPAFASIKDIFKLYQKLYPYWDASFSNDLLQKYGLSEKQKLGSLSNGQKRQVGLICAVAHKPELLILDEPAGGLDPVVRTEFLEDVISLLQNRGSTILFSSHHLADVERIANRVGILHDNTFLVDAEVDDLQENHTEFQIPDIPGLSAKDLLDLPECVWAQDYDHHIKAIFGAGSSRAQEILTAKFPQIQNAQQKNMNLEEIFVALVGGKK